MNKLRFYFLTIIGLCILSCSPDNSSPQADSPYTLKKPSHFPQPIIPADNPLTVNKIQLGRMLFYEKKLSEDNLVACANCHKQEFAFGSDKQFDRQVHGTSTIRNSSVLFNLAFTNTFFWDGRTNTLELTCKDALIGEMKFNLDFVTSKLMTEQRYKDKFNAAFQTEKPTEDMIFKALASFIRTMVSGNSKVDQGIKEGSPNKYLSAPAIEGKAIFQGEEGDCFHCHGNEQTQPIMTDNLFHNNGLDSFMSAGLFRDAGRGIVTGATGSDVGKFKTPPMRNLSYSAPFMHDGRIAGIDGVLKHYNMGVKNSISIDPNMKKVGQGGLQLTPDRIARLKEYILSFDDPSFITDTSFKSPF
jgi:cytochrome c peroxidase